jgi:hypothetical protein
MFVECTPIDNLKQVNWSFPEPNDSILSFPMKYHTLVDIRYNARYVVKLLKPRFDDPVDDGSGHTSQDS